MVEIILIALYFFIVGFETHSMGLFDEDNCHTPGNKIIIVLFCITIGVATFPLTLGIKISKFFLDRE